MKIYFAVQKAQQITFNPRMEMPSAIIVSIGLLTASPLGGTLIFSNGMPLPANLISLFSLANSLILERYFYRFLMMLGYAIQYRSKVMAAIPVALQIIAEAISRIIRVLFTTPERIHFHLRQNRVKALIIKSLKYSGDRRREIEGLVQRGWLIIQGSDDFFWRNKIEQPVIKTKTTADYLKVGGSLVLKRLDGQAIGATVVPVAVAINLPS